MSLNPKQKMFAEEYVVDYNATQAAIRAGYSEKTARQQANRLLKSQEILDVISAAQKDKARRCCISEDKIITELNEILQRCMTAVPVMEWDYSEHCYSETGDYTFDSKGAIKAIELLGKHLGMFDQKKNGQTVSHDDGFLEALNQKAGEMNWEE